MGHDEPHEAAYLLEPFGRNTAPAVALAALLVQARHGADAVMLVLAADHLIHDQQAFGAAVTAAAALAREGRLVTFGITPTLPETGLRLHRVRRRHRRARVRGDALRREAAARKGTRISRGRQLCVEFGHVRVHRRARILASFARYAPAVARSGANVSGSRLAAKSGDAMLEIDAASFAAAPDMSIDYAVMEKAAADGKVAVVRGDFDWSDVGSWQAISELTDADVQGNRGSGERVAIDTRGTFVHSEDRVVATIGVENLVIVDTPDAVLVAHRITCSG